MNNILKLTRGESISVLDFSGDTYTSTSGGGYDTSLYGVLDIEFKLWLDNESEYDNAVLGMEPDNTLGTRLYPYLLDASLFIFQNTGTGKHYSLNNLSNKILKCVIRKNENAASQGPEFFKIDGVEQSGITGTPGIVLTGR